MREQDKANYPASKKHPEYITVESVYDLISKSVNTSVSFSQNQLKSLLTFGDMAAPNFNTWFHRNYGKVKLPAAIQTKLTDHYDDFVRDVHEHVLNAVSDQSRFMYQLKLLVYQDPTISDETKCQLASGDSDSEIAAQIIRFAVSRNTSSLSECTDVMTIFENVEMPFWSKEVYGRESELKTISESLEQSNVLFLSGVGGIGKSVLAQEFARQNADVYHNRLFLSYHGSLRETITKIRFPGDQMMAEEKRFEFSFGLLKTLGRDSLIVIDNLDQLPEKNQDESLLKQLQCHILVTTRLSAWSGPILQIRPLPVESLIHLFYFYCPPHKAGTEESVERLVSCVNGHTYATQLLAQVVNEGFLTSEELSALLIQEGLSSQHTQINVFSHKDGNADYQPFYQLMVGLFPIINLSDSCKLCLTQCAMIPTTGIRKRTLGKWLGRFQDLQMLIRLGWLQEDTDQGILYMHTLIRDTVFSELKPTIEQCQPLIESILNSCDLIHHRLQSADASNVDEILGSFPNIRHMMSIQSPHPIANPIIANPIMMLCSLYGTLLCVRYIEREYDFNAKEPDRLDAGERNSLAATALEYVGKRNLNVITANGMTNRQLYDTILAPLAETPSNIDQTVVKWLRQAQALYQEFLQEETAWGQIRDVAVYQILSSMADAMGGEPPEVGYIISPS